MSEPRTPEELNDYEDLLDGTEHRWRNRMMGLAVLAALLAVGGYALWAMALSGGGSATAEVRTAEVERGSITNTVTTSGVVVAQSTTSLSFDQSGTVSAVNVTLGQEVKAGDVLAELDSDELQDAVTSAEVNLSSARTRLNQLLRGASAADLASADQSLVQAQANLNQASRSLQDLLEGPTESELLSAQQAVASAQASSDQANRTLQDLLEGPTESERLSAEQSVASAQASLDQANRTLQDLLEGPTESERLSSEQAVASAEAQLVQAEASRTQLYSANDDAVAAAEEAVRKAESALDNAERTADSAESSLTSAEASLRSTETAYCDKDTTPDFCTLRAAPISSADEAAMLDATADFTLAASASAVLAANTSYLRAVDSKASADDAVESAEADLAAAQRDLNDARSGPSSEDLAKADAAVASAQDALATAEAKLAELGEEPSQSQVDAAEDSVDTARAGLASAQAKLAEVNEGPTQNQLDTAQDGVDTARAALASAQAKLAELSAEPTQSELGAAQDNVTTANASLAAAAAKANDTYDGADSEDIELQGDSVRLAELSLERAKKDLEKAQIIAPFDGTVAALNIEVGELAGGAGGDAAIILNTPDAVRMDLVITESDIPSVEAGQSGVAMFDAIENRPFPIVIESIGTNPTTTQGVVTYEARARIIDRPTQIAGDLFPGRSDAGASQTTATPATGAARPDATPTSTPTGAPVAEGTPSAGAGSAGGAMTLPSNVDIDFDARPLPGMNASVTITVEQAQDVITVPAQAIQTEGRESVVEVVKEDGSTERLVVQTGLSDGTNTEITEGLEEGQTVIVPTVAAAAAQPTVSAGFPQGGFPGGGIREGGPPGDGGIIIGGSP